jgi:hypothetical protein
MKINEIEIQTFKLSVNGTNHADVVEDPGANVTQVCKRK